MIDDFTPDNGRHPAIIPGTHTLTEPQVLARDRPA